MSWLALLARSDVAKDVDPGRATLRTDPVRGAAQLSVQEIGLLRTAEKDRITLEQLIVRPNVARILN